METTIYLEKKLTPEVLEGLEENKEYYLIVNGGTKQCLLGSTLKEAVLVQKNSNPFTYILLPLTVTSDMVEKEAEKVSTMYRDSEYMQRSACINGFNACYDWLLNINKEGEK